MKLNLRYSLSWHSRQSDLVMRMEEKDFSKYYLIRIFEKKQYAAEFVSGVLFMNSSSSHRINGNEAQRDPEEGYMLRSGKQGKIKLYVGDTPNFDLSEAKSVDIIDVQHHVYACSFYFLEKDVVQLESEFMIREDSPHYHDFCKMIDEYGNCWVVVLDMSKFVQKIEEQYPTIKYGVVDYVDDIEKGRLKVFDPQNPNKSDYIKSRDFCYQHEFRLIVSKGAESKEEAIKLCVHNMRECVVKTFCTCDCQ